MYFAPTDSSKVSQAIRAALVYNQLNTLDARSNWLTCLDVLSDRELGEYLVRHQMVTAILAAIAFSD